MVPEAPRSRSPCMSVMVAMPPGSRGLASSRPPERVGPAAKVTGQPVQNRWAAGPRGLPARAMGSAWGSGSPIRVWKSSI